ncbi:hypothetical protein Lalb_Chr21g0313921 [Lupinus albus]|uniref:Reverse transcriptase domain-containing protein n=1 Tax=Lupinus albus TaxID=3870 RepID=A0A6A4NM26_LUPAL|nr:hypothetical protein Lalb_Chr21g0313921 [Lupinus albus]
MRQATSLGFFTLYLVGYDNISISLLQYANDAILIGDCSGKTFWAMKNILKFFDLSSRLKIKFNKSTICGLNTEGIIFQDSMISFTVRYLHTHSPISELLRVSVKGVKALGILSLTELNPKSHCGKGVKYHLVDG